MTGQSSDEAIRDESARLGVPARAIDAGSIGATLRRIIDDLDAFADLRSPPPEQDVP